VVPQFRVLTPDGTLGFSGPGMFQLGNWYTRNTVRYEVPSTKYEIRNTT
jgi:hypothetical protein